MATDPLVEAVRAIHERWPEAASERFPVILDWEPQAVDVGTTKSQIDQSTSGAVPAVPRVPSENEYSSHCTARACLFDRWAAWIERAAIREHDGGMSRSEADVATALELGPCPADHGSAQAIFALKTHSQ